MISNEVNRLERENNALKQALQELGRKMEQNQTIKPKSCQYCKYYVQHYMRGSGLSRNEYTAIYAGHCLRGIPACRGGKKKPKPDETCDYFEVGTLGIRYSEM